MFDENFRQTWLQAELPVRWGGLGVRGSKLIAPSAYPASVCAKKTLVSNLL